MSGENRGALLYNLVQLLLFPLEYFLHDLMNSAGMLSIPGDLCDLKASIAHSISSQVKLLLMISSIRVPVWLLPAILALESYLFMKAIAASS